MFLSEIIRNFDSQLSQEQTWAVCYVTANNLASKRRENVTRRRKVQFEVEAETIQLTECGNVLVMMRECTGSVQLESELVKKLGQLLCKCLNRKPDKYPLQNNNSCEPDIGQFISEILFLKCEENDEGYEGDHSVSPRNSFGRVRHFRTLDEICQYCDVRLLEKNIKSGSEHYRNVVAALYGEALELKLFLDHVTWSLDSASEKKENRSLEPSVAYTAQECVYEWARLWLQVMHELRRGVHLRKVTQTEISPEEFELLPYEMVSDGCVSSGIKSKPGEASGLPENASEVILDFILSRPVEKKKKTLLPYIEEDSSESDENYDLEVSKITEEYENAAFDHRRKSLKVESPLWSKIHNWDASLESLLSDDRVIDMPKPRTELFSTEINEPRRNSVEIGVLHLKESKENSPAHIGGQDVPFEGLGTRNGTLDHTKKRLAVSAMCLTEVSLDEDPRAVGTSIYEIAKTRQAITFAELDALPASIGRNRGVKNGKICFSCRKTSFSLFNKASFCDICTKKFCTSCIVTNFEIPNHLVDVNKNKCDEDLGDLNKTKFLSKSYGNIAESSSNDTITPFPCKRQSLLRIGSKRIFGGKTVIVCKDCKCFLNSIITETKNYRWHVGMEIDI